VGDLWSATRPGTGGYVTAATRDELAHKMDAF